MPWALTALAIACGGVVDTATEPPAGGAPATGGGGATTTGGSGAIAAGGSGAATTGGSAATAAGGSGGTTTGGSGGATAGGSGGGSTGGFGGGAGAVNSFDCPSVCARMDALDCSSESRPDLDLQCDLLCDIAPNVCSTEYAELAVCMDPDYVLGCGATGALVRGCDAETYALYVCLGPYLGWD